MLLQLRGSGHQDASAKVLSRLGLIEEYPIPAGSRAERGRRYRGASPETQGAVVWEKETAWPDPTVAALLDVAIAAAREAQPPVRPTLGPA